MNSLSFRPIHFIILFLSLIFLIAPHVLGSPDPSKPCYGKKIKGMQCIPEGYFIRGSNTHDPDEAPEQKIYLSDFYIDLYEVTNEDFSKCIEEGSCKDCLYNGNCDYIGPAYGDLYLKPKQPVLGVSWYTAKEYCEWVGKRLPTEAEWEKAARGPKGNLFPWGNKPANCKLAVIEEDERKGCVYKKINPPNLMPTAPVGSRPAGVYGLFDMAGNSWEWVHDWYSENYKVCGEACSGKDPKGPCEGEDNCPGYNKKTLKGGSWWWPASYARGSKRRAHFPQNYPEYHHFGFRCAKDAG
ncbi:formylglycine-generating enzyme family protein [Leptospira sp. WS58.C1]|uniref:formylglycine-generating enzyme family protein n=1 Tax=Leptospira TaxID=171 RepID=UPI0002BD354C|nr:MULTISPECIES: SUMF1/EgtB/PvdO family nonheme iron enzyme [unclassified Leptospira]EMJ97327.1 formylglycine-generating sulfatase enzyme [Leptospira sp. B5-022]MCR1794828.1 formylglycine-generating enzyme family protein [Leptospira sp. id769339]